MGRSNRLLPSSATMLFVALTLVLCGSGSKLLNDGDTGYHIRTGEFILDRLQIPRHDLFSFHDPPIPWTAHEWLAETVMGLLHRMGGLTAVVLFFVLLLALTYTLLARNCNRLGANPLLATAGAALAAGCSNMHWLARPHLFTLFLLTVWCGILEEFRTGSRDRLYLLPLLMIFWVNLHGGFIFGLAIGGIYVAGEILSGAERRGVAGRLCLFLGAAAGTALLNPLGWRIYLFPFRMISDKYLADHVMEFASPNFHNPLLFPYLLFALLMVFALAPRKPAPVELLLTVILGLLSLRSIRHIPVFALVVTPFLVRHAGELIDQGKGRMMSALRERLAQLGEVDGSSDRFLWPVAAIVTVVILTVSGKVSCRFDPEMKPVAAVEFLLKEQLPGNPYNNDEFGDYLIYAGQGRYRVFFDGRSDMYGEGRMKEYFEVQVLAPGWEKILDKYRIDWILFDTDSILVRQLWGNPGWHPVYTDAVATIFVRKNATFASLVEKYPRPAALPPRKEDRSA